MNDEKPEFYCSSVETTVGEVFFCGVELHRYKDDPSALNLATMNIAITDGRRAWKGEGLNEMYLGTTIPNRMRHALEALVQFQEPSEQYSVRLTPQQAEVLVEVEWDNKRHGKDIVYRVHFLLDAAPDAAEAVQWVMGSTVDACLALKEEAARLEEACALQQKAAEAEYKTLEEYASRKEEIDGDLALKTAALLAAKQEHLAELLRQF